jgi:hypothetical protein
MSIADSRIDDDGDVETLMNGWHGWLDSTGLGRGWKGRHSAIFLQQTPPTA